MTTQDLIRSASEYPWLLLAYFLILPILTVLLGLLHDRHSGGRPPWRYFYAAIVYLVCIPGMLAAVLTGYALFFTGKNLLQVNLLVYFLPI
ncbi:hypothetical protein ACFL2Q_19150, partial [Thermodesulfobacteriota bacterium]